MLSGKGLYLGLNNCQTVLHSAVCLSVIRGGPGSLGAVAPCKIKKCIR